MVRGTMRGARLATICGVLVAAAGAARAADDSLAADLVLLATSGNGPTGQQAQQAAWARVAASGADELPTILAGFRGATQVGENWLRSAADAIGERELHNKRPLPVAELEAFVNDAEQDPRARRVAYELLTAADNSAPSRLLPTMLGDSSLELRYDAAQRVIDAASAAADEAAKKTLYRQAFDAARDVGQVKACAEALKGLGEEANIPAQLGYVMKWKVIGPYDNAGLHGFAAEYKPESVVDFAAKDTGKTGEVAWTDAETKDDFGNLDLKKAVSDDKEVVAYAAATLVSPQSVTGQLRASSSNALKLWINGRQVAAYEIYHTGNDVDQYVVPVEIRAGENIVLVKCCQNEQEQSWEKVWGFQLRVTDELGAALPVEVK